MLCVGPSVLNLNDNICDSLIFSFSEMLGILAILLLKRSPLWIIPWEVLECPFAAKFLHLTLQSNIILYILCVGMLIGILANLNAYLIPLLLSVNINEEPNKYNTLTLLWHCT